MSKKVTMQQIADYLGVSKFVVSRSLSGKEGVNSTTRDQVFDAAAKLGYYSQKNKKINQPIENQESRPNRNNKNEIVLVLMQNIRHQTKDSSYWGKIVDGISCTLEDLGIGIFVMTESNVEKLTTVLNPKHFIGAIGVGVISAPLLLEVDRMKLPIILIDYEDPLIRCDTIFNNNFDCSYHLTNHLIGLGHKQIQFIGDINYSRSFYDRWLGFRSSLEQNNLTAKRDASLETIDNSEIEMHFENWFIEKTNSFLSTAFVCANDNIATRVISVLKKFNMNVPDDLSIVGFDNKEITYQMSPTLTTVDIAKSGLGKRAVEMLLKRISEKNAPFEKVLLAGTIMLRESTSKVRDVVNDFED
ncbi:MAG: LacI family DNA-binding transcriptional regulator [Anaerobacillus sp.]|uniref:LacI family DNA-binding transcriptional regulator n=1 Tax=Anaerobacillus sp. TaxID=1872506 RepID=UPI00391A64E4